MRRLVALALLGGACAPHRASGPLPVRHYRILVAGRDSLCDALAKTLRERGLAIERHVHGGGPPVAAVVMFTFRDPGLGRMFGLRLADTRTGIVVAAVSVLADSLGDTAHAARLLADSLLARPPAP